MELDEFCYTVQQDLNDLAGTNYPAYKRESVGMLDAVLSSENTSAIPEPMRVDAGDGKLKQVIVRYLQPGLLSEVQNATVNICTDAGTEDAYQTDLVTVSRYRRSPVIALTKGELRKLCESTSEQRANVIATKMSSLMRSISMDLAALYNTKAGAFVDGTLAPKDVDLLYQDGEERAYPKGELEIMRDFSDLDITGRPILVGKGNLWSYTKYADIGCCNRYGQSIDELSDFAYYMDNDYGSVVGGADQFAAWAPGAVQLIDWNENVGDFETIHPHSLETTMVDPVSGMTFDMEMYYDRCDKKYKLFFFKHYDLYLMPDTIYQATDDRFGANNAFKYNATIAVPEPAV